MIENVFERWPNFKFELAVLSIPQLPIYDRLESVGFLQVATCANEQSPSNGTLPYRIQYLTQDLMDRGTNEGPKLPLIVLVRFTFFPIPFCSFYKVDYARLIHPFRAFGCGRFLIDSVSPVVA